MMHLSKTIPTRKKVCRFNWCRKDYMKMSQQYRNIRSRSQNPMDTCYWCGHKFIDGEMMALAQPTRGSNKMLCQHCANELMGSD